MIFHEKYEILSLRGGQQEIALPGKEISTGRPVLVHLLSAGYTPGNEELLRAIALLPASGREHILDSGDQDGIPFVVTDMLPEKLSLKDWVMQAATPASSKTGAMAMSGVWKLSASPEPQAAAPQWAAPDATPAADPGEFTRLFHMPAKPAEVAMPPASTPVAAPAAPRIPSQDETVTMAMPAFSPGGAAARERTAAPPAAPPVAPATPPAAAPGEFTSLFQASKPEAPPAVTAPEQLTGETACPTPAAPGEFTSLFQASKPAPPPAASTPTAAAPGEFTSLFRASMPAPPPAAPAPPPTAAPPGEFTSLFRASKPPEPTVSAPEQPRGETARPTPAAAGEFTRLFEAPAPAQKSPPAALTPAIKPAPLPPAAGPGEFTRMMQSPLARDPLPAAPPPAPAAPRGEFTKMLEDNPFAQAPAARPALPPQPPARDSQFGGEFTRIFGPESTPENIAPPPVDVPLPSGGLATGAFSRRSAAPPQTTQPSGPSEFTRMFAASAPAPLTAAKAPAAPAPPAVPAKSAKSYLPLILILGGLFLLVVILVVIFALTR